MGSGLYGMLVLAIITVFVAGLMVGLTSVGAGSIVIVALLLLYPALKASPAPTGSTTGTLRAGSLHR